MCPCRLGEDAPKSSWGILDYVPFVLGGGLVVYGLYWLLKKKELDQVAPVAPKEAPSKYADFNAVVKRFTQLKELWHMGYVEAPQVATELRALKEEALIKAAANQATREQADNLLAQMEVFSNDVGYDLLANRLTGSRYIRIMNGGRR